ncbi:MAG: hypothetical protein R2820_13935 [Cyclobacteriaceae bacterium]|nr:hypothetical protein [Cyclobacteriaceae bacterium]
MHISQITLSGLLALPILIPIIFGIRAFKHAGVTLRLFLFFLLIGLAVDIIMWVLISSGTTTHLLNIFNTYSLLEALFFFWFIWQVSELRVLRRLAKGAWVIVLPFWLFCVVIYPYLNIDFVSGSALFNASYEIIGSFLAGFALLNLIEHGEQPRSSSTFWFLTAIFFYCFSTFFLMTLLETFLAIRVWFLNNIFNNITYLLYAVGFWVFLRVRLKGTIPISY